MYEKLTAKAIYERLKTKRESFLRRARMASAVTIPALVPPDGWTGTNDFNDPEQSLGARGINHLSSKLLLTLLPPSAPFFRLVPDAIAREQMGGEDEESRALRAEVEKKLAEMEQEVQREVEVQSLRVGGSEILKHLPVAGNVCMHLPEEGGLDMFPIDSYVVKRDPSGNLLCLVIREVIDKEVLEEEAKAIRDAYLGSDVSSETDYTSDENNCELYTKVIRDGKKFKVHQELMGMVVPGTEGDYIEDDLPYHPLRWTKVAGEDYGRGLVEDYYSDLLALEKLSRAMVNGSLAMARLVFLVNPNGTTDPHDLAEAENGDFAYGSSEEVTTLQANKFGDFRVAMEQAGVITKRLEDAFLLNRSATRQAERVTAEEIRLVAADLQSALSGVYSVLAQEFQLPLVRRLMSRLQKKGAIPKFSKQLKDHIRPAIVTGVEALGRGQELERVRAIFGVMQQIIGPEQVAQVTNMGQLVDFLFSSGGVRIEGLIKSEEQLAQEQQQAQQMQMMQEALSKGVGPAVNAVSAATQQDGQAAPPPEGG